MTTCPDCGAPWSGTLSCPECDKREREHNSPQIAIDPPIGSSLNHTATANVSVLGGYLELNKDDQIPAPPLYAKVLAVICGFVLLGGLAISWGLWFRYLSLYLLLLGVPIGFCLAGFLFGFTWPKPRWKWGLWLSVVIIPLGIPRLLNGELITLDRGIGYFIGAQTFFLTPLITSCAGAFIGALIKLRGISRS